MTNILLPAWIKTYGSRRTMVALMTTYTTVLAIAFGWEVTDVADQGELPTPP